MISLCELRLFLLPIIKISSRRLRYRRIWQLSSVLSLLGWAEKLSIWMSWTEKWPWLQRCLDFSWKLATGLVDCPTQLILYLYSSVVFHDKYERTQQGNLLPLVSPWLIISFVQWLEKKTNTLWCQGLKVTVIGRIWFNICYYLYFGQWFVKYFWEYLSFTLDPRILGLMKKLKKEEASNSKVSEIADDLMMKWNERVIMVSTYCCNTWPGRVAFWSRARKA